MKKCSNCKEEKPISDFHTNKRTKDGYTYYCKTCSSLRAKRWAENNPEKVKDIHKKWRENNREKERLRAKKNYKYEKGNKKA